PACVYASALCCRTPSSAPSPYTTLFRSVVLDRLDEFGRNLRLVMAVRDQLVCRDSELGTDLENRLLLRRARYCDIGLEFSHEGRSEEHTSELQSRENLVRRLLLEVKNDQ